MKVLVAQHKGGVGKTTLSIHVAAVLISPMISRILLMDCDTQGDLYRFFTGHYPSQPLDVAEGLGETDVIWNPNREKFSSQTFFSAYDHIVVDVDTRVMNSLQIFAEFSPTVVLVPVDRQALSVEHGKQVCILVEQAMAKHGYDARIIIVQMGSSHDLIKVFPNYSINKITYSEDFDKCLNGGGYIWEVNSGLAFVFDEFASVLNHV